MSAASTANLNAKVGIPLWVMGIGAVGISLGLLLLEAKLVRTVAKQLTTLDQTRAFCICLSAAITVIAPSAMGFPVSSTHIAIGSVFGVGFYRECCCNSKNRKPKRIRTHLKRIVMRILQKETATVSVKITRKLRKLVRRRQLLTIVAAWFITVPCAAVIAAVLFYIAQVFAV